MPADTPCHRMTVKKFTSLGSTQVEAQNPIDQMTRGWEQLDAELTPILYPLLAQTAIHPVEVHPPLYWGLHLANTPLCLHCWVLSHWYPLLSIRWMVVVSAFLEWLTYSSANIFIGQSDCSCSSLLSFSQPNCIVVHLWLQWLQTPFCSQSNPAPPRRILSYTSLPIWMLLLHSPAQWAVLTHNAGPHLCRLLIRLSFQILAGILHLFLALIPPCTNTSALH